VIPYLGLKAAHVACVLIFVGGLFSQSFAVAAGRRGDAATVALLSRWDGRVTVPAMLLVWLSGALLATEGAWFASHWLWAKLVIVVGLTGLHGVQSGRLRRLRNGADRQAGSFVPVGIVAVAVALIALLVVAKPF
jgi:putative membrane protein